MFLISFRYYFFTPFITTWLFQLGFKEIFVIYILSYLIYSRVEINNQRFNSLFNRPFILYSDYNRISVIFYIYLSQFFLKSLANTAFSFNLGLFGLVLSLLNYAYSSISQVLYSTLLILSTVLTLIFDCLDVSSFFLYLSYYSCLYKVIFSLSLITLW